MVDTDVIKVIVIDAIFVRFNQNCNTVFIRSTVLCFILTVALNSSLLCTVSISRLFLMIALETPLLAAESAFMLPNKHVIWEKGNHYC